MRKIRQVEGLGLKAWQAQKGGGRRVLASAKSALPFKPKRLEALLPTKKNLRIFLKTGVFFK